MRTLEEYNDVKKVYIAVWHSITSLTKKDTKTYIAAIENDGPLFL